LIPPTFSLAFSRLRRTWGLLLISELGLLGAVLLVCAVPLFSQVAVSSGLRGALAESSGGPALTISLYAINPTRDSTRQAGARVDSLVQDELSAYLAGKPSFAAQMTLPITKNAPSSRATPSGSKGPGGETGLTLDGRDMNEASAHLRLVSGRLPAASGAQIELALLQDSATALGVGPGATLYGQVFSGPSGPTTLPLRVVGVYAPTSASDPYWNMNAENFGGPVVKLGGGGQLDTALVSADSLITALNTATSGDTSGQGGSPLQLTWRYPLALDSITGDDLGPLTSRYNELRDRAQNQLGSQDRIVGAQTGGALDTLGGYQGRAIGLQVVVLILLLQVLGLVILFVSLAAGILVERQSEAIALLRSRGAKGRQIVGALAFQGVGASLVALIAGPLLAIPLVRLIAGALLPADNQRGLNVLDRDPLALAWDVRWYALIAALGATIAIVVSIYRAATRNVLTLRRESSRAGPSFWQRLNLDLIGAVVLLALYALYLWGIQQIPFQIRLALSALAIVAPLLLLVAIALLFSRFFPLALRAAARLTARRSGPTFSLALAQMARAPRQSSRMLLLLALSTAFTLFTLIITVSQAAHIADLTNFQAGADFAGTLSSGVTSPAAPATAPTLAELTRRYGAIHGVRSASVGYQGDSNPEQAPPYSVVAVDADTYAATAFWSPAYSTQSLGELLKLLANGRASATTDHVVPAIVDDALWTQSHVASDGHFTLAFPGHDGRMKFLAVARVAHIPPIADTPEFTFNTSGGLLVDYATFASAFNEGQTASDAHLTPNTVWLRTDDDDATLASVRATLTAGDLALTDMLDRRKMLADAQGDPLQIDLVGALGLGAGTALALALIGAWLACWLNARSRLTSFAVLRALGTTPRQILALLLWEQGIVYVCALGLGLLLGLLLAQGALPALVFTSALARTSSRGGPPIDVPPVQTILPVGQLALVLGGVAAVCLIALTLTTLILSRASLAEALRLNQD
jgi:ABC-type antimicrobial peptide transport system permease subunit